MRAALQRRRTRLSGWCAVAVASVPQLLAETSVLIGLPHLSDGSAGAAGIKVARWVAGRGCAMNEQWGLVDAVVGSAFATGIGWAMSTLLLALVAAE